MNKNNGTKSTAAREIYEMKVGIEAYERAGNNPQLKGIVHEVLYKDAQTMAPKNLLSGTKGMLTKSTTAIRDDVVFINKGSVVGRAQLKDTANSISKTVKQAASGKYQGTNLVGTKETVAAYEKAVSRLGDKGIVVTQKMKSSGISSSDTARIAAKTVGGKLQAGTVAKIAGSSGITGGVISGGIEAFCAGKDLIDGRIDGGEFMSRVTKETVGGGLSAAGGSVAATAAATGAATLLATTAAPIWFPAAIGVGTAVAVGTVVKGIWDSLWD